MKQTKNIIERIEAVGGKFSTAYRKEYEAIPVLKCEFKEENKEDILKKTGGSWIGAGQLGEGKSLVVYYNGEIVFADYLLTDGCYLGSALALFNTASIWSRQSKWFNLYWLIVLRHIIRENYNHGLDLDDILYEEKPLTFDRIKTVRRLAKEKDKYASIR